MWWCGFVDVRNERTLLDLWWCVMRVVVWGLESSWWPLFLVVGARGGMILEES